MKGSEHASNPYEHCLSASLRVGWCFSVRGRILNSQRGGQRFDPAQLHQNDIRKMSALFGIPSTLLSTGPEEAAE
jgi:hypothetical protein